MKTVAIDTNALLDYRLKREPHFSEVKSLFEHCLDGRAVLFVPEPIFLECEWVLRFYYKQSKDQIIKFFQELLLVDNIVLKDKKEIELTLNFYKSTQGVSFTDCLILCQVQAFQPDEFLTFDEELQKLYKEQ